MKFLFSKNNKRSIDVFNRISEKTLYFKGTKKVYKGKHVRILANGKFFSLKNASPSARQLSLRKTK